MHFTTLFVLKGEELENLSFGEIDREFQDRYCYCCGETKAKYVDWCDWFQIGGRWFDILRAKTGLHGEPSWFDKNTPVKDGKFSIVNIRDLTEPIDKDMIYSVATKSRLYLKNDDWSAGEVNPVKFNQLLDQINNKEFDGVIALIDCHD